MESKGGLFYVTADVECEANSSIVDVLKAVKEQQNISTIPKSTGAHVYRATDASGAGKGKPQWLVMWESNDVPEPYVVETMSSQKGFRRDVFSLQSEYTAHLFTSEKLQDQLATNFIVAVIILLNKNFKAEYDKYYEEEHIGALMEVPGWRRTRRFVETPGYASSRASGQIQILQMHDYDPDNYGIEGQEFKKATSTPWYKEMMANAVVAKDRRTYELYGFVPAFP